MDRERRLVLMAVSILTNQNLGMDGYRHWCLMILKCLPATASRNWEYLLLWKVTITCGFQPRIRASTSWHFIFTITMARVKSTNMTCLLVRVELSITLTIINLKRIGKIQH